MGHAVPWPLLVGVWIGLMILTVVTVAVTYVDLGALNIIIAMGVATMKATLVVAFFMHLFWDKPLNTVTFLLSTAFVAVFLAFTIIDTKQYKAAVDQFNTDKIVVVDTTPPPPPNGKVWEMPKLEDDDKVAYERAKAIADKGPGDAAAGKAVFTQKCAVCHKLGGEGQEVGPHLDEFDRANKERLIVSIAAPSAEIREGYDNYMYRRSSGGPVIMVKVKEDDKTVTGRDSTGKEIVLQKSEIKGEPKKLPVSLMPTGLFDGSEEDVRNLIQYIQSFPPVAPAAAPAK